MFFPYRALQKINKHKVINTCRLCLKPGAETNIFIIKDINYAEAIKQVLDIEVCPSKLKAFYLVHTYRTQAKIFMY